GAEADFVEGLLNSALANAWLKVRDPGRDIKLSTIADLPIVRDKELERRIGGLARAIRATRSSQHRRLDRCPPSLRKSQLVPRSSGRIASLVAQMDCAVYELYRLRPGERHEVEKLSAT